MKTSKLVWTVGLSLLWACGGGDDGGGDTNAMTIGMTLGGTAADDGGTAADDGGGSGTAADDGGDTTAGADDGGMDTGMDDGAACDPECAPGEECIAGQCFGGDDGSTGEPPAECGTNVMLMPAACDECVKGACCDAMQACFGDETVAMATPCFELNNCIAMNCTMAMSIEELQTCVDENCAETSAELQTWLTFNNCAFMSCMAQCAA